MRPEVTCDHAVVVGAGKTEEASQDTDGCYEMPERGAHAQHQQEHARYKITDGEERIPTDPAPISDGGKKNPPWNEVHGISTFLPDARSDPLTSNQRDR